MQGRIVGVVKQLIETLKREIKGPGVIDRKFDMKPAEICEKKVEGITTIEYKDIKKECVILDLKESTMPEIMELTLKKSCNEVKFFNDRFNDLINFFVFDKPVIKILEKKSDISKDSILKKVEVKFSTKISGLREEFKSDRKNIKNGIDIIYNFPKKIVGKRGDDLYKKEYDNLQDKLNLWKKKNGINNFIEIEAEYVFKDIPIGRVKNIKFDSDKGVAELYFNETKSSEKLMDFVIIYDKISGKREKIFI